MQNAAVNSAGQKALCTSGAAAGAATKAAAKAATTGQFVALSGDWLAHWTGVSKSLLAATISADREARAVPIIRVFCSGTGEFGSGQCT